MLPGLYGLAGSVNLTTPTITFLHSTVNATTTTVISFGNATPTTPGLLVVTCLSTSATTRLITEISIGGTTGTIHTVSAGAGTQRACASRVVSSGANSISVTYNSTTTTAGNSVGAWLITGYSSTVPVSAGNVTVGASTLTTLDLTQANNGVGVASGSPQATTVNMGWTNATSVASSTLGTTLRVDWATITSSVAATLTISTTYAAAQTGRIVAATFR